MSTFLLQLLLTLCSLPTPPRRHALTCTPRGARSAPSAAHSRPPPLLRQMVAKPLSERLDKPAVHKASSFEGHARAGVTGARIRQPNVAGAADVSAASPELASQRRARGVDGPDPAPDGGGARAELLCERRVLGAVRGREGASGPDLDGAVGFGSVRTGPDGRRGRAGLPKNLDSEG